MEGQLSVDVMPAVREVRMGHEERMLKGNTNKRICRFWSCRLSEVRPIVLKSTYEGVTDTVNSPRLPCNHCESGVMRKHLGV